MKITTSMTFTLMGSFFSFPSQGALGRRLEQEGGATTRDITKSTEVIIVGNSEVSSSGSLQKQFNLPVLNEEQLATLLEQGFIEVEDLHAERSLDVMLGDVRSILDGPLGESSWSELVKVVEDCRPEARADLIAYVQDHLTQLESHGDLDPLVLEAPYRWFFEASKGVSTHPDVMTEHEHVVFHNPNWPLGSKLPSVLTALRPVPTVSLRFWSPPESDWIPALVELELPHLEHLDLHGLDLRFTELHVDSRYLEEQGGNALQVRDRGVALLNERLIEHLPGSPLAESLSSIRLGWWHSSELTEALEASGLQVIQ